MYGGNYGFTRSNKHRVPGDWRFQPKSVIQLLVFALILGAVTSGLAATSQPLRVLRVLDGDSLLIQLDNTRAPAAQRLELRLMDIDAPESCQAGGAESRASLKALVQGRALQVELEARDRYGRSLGRLYAGDIDIGGRQVALGHAWSARKRWGGGPWMAQERAARQQGLGLHASADPQRPQDFRRSHGACAYPVRAQKPGASRR